VLEAPLHAHVLVRTPDGRLTELVHGDLIGRVWTAALQLNDGRVSEAHAMVSLREGRLELIALRGAFAVDGQPLPRVALSVGLRVQLARGIELEVVDVRLPDAVLGVEGPSLARQALPGVCSVVADPAPRLAQGFREDAAACIWTTGDGWMIRRPDGASVPLRGGDTLVAGGQTLQFVDIALHAAGPAATRRRGEVDSPVTIVAHFDTVHVHRAGEPAVTFSGKQAQLISELVACGGPLGWSALTEELWSDEEDPALRRSRLDVLLTRIRRKLRAGGVRADLVRTDGAGMVELFTYPYDTVENNT